MKAYDPSKIVILIGGVKVEGLELDGDMRPYKYLTNGTEEKAVHIHEMQDHDALRKVTYETMRRNCEGLVEYGIRYLYYKQRGDTMRKDEWNGYYKSFFRGRPCYFLEWRGVTYIWVQK